MKIIRLPMNDDRPPDHLSHMKPPGENLHIGSPVIGQQRRQVPCMVWMQDTAGIKVRAGVGKTLTLAVCSLMNVEGKETRFRPGKSHHLRLYNHAILPLKESHNSPNCRMAAVSVNLCDSIWKSISHQSIAPLPFYAEESLICMQGTYAPAGVAERGVRMIKPLTGRPADLFSHPYRPPEFGATLQGRCWADRPTNRFFTANGSQR